MTITVKIGGPSPFPIITSFLAYGIAQQINRENQARTIADERNAQCAA